MDILSRYLEVVPLPVLLACGGGILALFLMIPAKWRLPVALVIMPVWLTVGRLPDLGTIRTVAKATGVLTYVLVGVSALLDPGLKQRLHPVAWLLPLSAAWAMICVLGVDELGKAMIIRVQWFVLILAALAVVRLMVDEYAIRRILMPLGVGCCIALLLPFSALMGDPGAAFRGFGRFFPHGANTNQIGALFALSAPLLLYLAVVSQRTLYKVILIGFVSLAGGMIMLTASRGALAAAVIAASPIVLHSVRRPLLATFAAGVGLAVCLWLLGRVGDFDLERLTNLETNRPDIWAAYVEIALQRPFGLVGVQDESAFAAYSIGPHPHNAYLEMMYIGGVGVLAPMAIWGFISMKSAVTVFRCRHESTDPLLWAVFCSFLIALLLHGFQNSIITYPTYTWSFWFVLVLTTLATRAYAIGGLYSFDTASGPYADNDDTELLAEHNAVVIPG